LTGDGQAKIARGAEPLSPSGISQSAPLIVETVPVPAAFTQRQMGIMLRHIC
jgi:hypothetical protein